MEIKSKAQLKSILSSLVKRGKIKNSDMERLVSKSDLPDYAGPRKGWVRPALGPLKSFPLKGKTLKGSTR